MGRMPVAAVLINDGKAQAAANRIGLNQFEFQPLPLVIAPAAVFADQRVGRLIITVIIIAQCGHRNDAIATDTLDRGEEAEILHAGNPRIDNLSDILGEIGRNITVGCLPLRCHGAPFGQADRLRNARQSVDFGFGEAAMFG